jgi:hypothetical protein
MTTQQKPTRNNQSSSSKSEYNPCLVIIAIYQIIRGLFGASLPVPFSLDLMFRGLLCIGGLLAIFSRSNRWMLLLALALSVPSVTVGTSFYWSPIQLELPLSFSFKLVLFQLNSASETESIRLGLDVVYSFLFSLVSFRETDSR